MCQHHWMIEEAHGTKSAAKCKKCGDETELYNGQDFDTLAGKRRGQTRQYMQSPPTEGYNESEGLTEQPIRY